MAELVGEPERGKGETCFFLKVCVCSIASSTLIMRALHIFSAVTLPTFRGQRSLFCSYSMSIIIIIIFLAFPLWPVALESSFLRSRSHIFLWRKGRRKVSSIFFLCFPLVKKMTDSYFPPPRAGKNCSFISQNLRGFDNLIFPPIDPCVIDMIELFSDMSLRFWILPQLPGKVLHEFSISPPFFLSFTSIENFSIARTMTI